MRKHPHWRGEDLISATLARVDWETPPLAWGRQLSCLSINTGMRNTPTGVGKTDQRDQDQPQRWKHPHWRGEDALAEFKDGSIVETPPLAWGRPATGEPRGPQKRNTPTGVGKTYLRWCLSCCNQKHPHWRGEDVTGSVIV